MKDKRLHRSRAEQQPLAPSSKGFGSARPTSQRCGVLVASCAISTVPGQSLAPPRCVTRDPRAPGLCSAGSRARHSCGGPLLLTRWSAAARCADGSCALQALLFAGRDQPGHSHAIYEASAYRVLPFAAQGANWLHTSLCQAMAMDWSDDGVRSRRSSAAAVCGSAVRM